MKTKLFLSLIAATPVLLAPSFTTSAIAAQNSPLEKAIQTNNVAAAQKIIESRDFDPNAVSEMGYYPLLFATSLKRNAIAKLLLANPKTNPNIISTYGDESALKNAIYASGTALFEVLLAHPKTDLNLPFGDPKTTPLIEAMNQNRVDIVKLLIANPKTNVALKDRNGQTPLQVATYLDKPVFITMLLATKKVDVNAVDNNKTAPIHEAAGNSSKTLQALLAAKNINPNLKDSEGETPIRIAARLNLANVKILMKVPKIVVTAADKKLIKEMSNPNRKGDLG